MEAKKYFHWVFMFALLSVTTIWVLKPGGGGAKEVLAYAAEINSAAFVIPHHNGEDLETSIIRRLLARLISKDLVCTVNEKQAAELSSRYTTNTDIVEVDGEDVTLFKIKNKRNVNSGTIMRYLRSSGGEPHCIVVPSRTWYYTVFTSTIS